MNTPLTPDYTASAVLSGILLPFGSLVKEKEKSGYARLSLVL